MPGPLVCAVHRQSAIYAGARAGANYGLMMAPRLNRNIDHSPGPLVLALNGEKHPD